MSGEAVLAAVAGRHVMLGKKQAQHRPSNFRLASYLRPKALQAAPSQVHYGQVVTRQGGAYPMYGNDRLGDCTCAAAGHHVQAWSYNAGRPETPPEQSVIRMYDETGDGTDDGRYLDEVLSYWRKTGLDGETVLAYASVNVKDRAEVKAALWLFGGLYLGVGLPVTAQRQTTWHVDASALAADRAPYSWGGHCVNATGYANTTGVYFVTWGRLTRLTWGFWNAYVDEAFAIVSPAWVTAQ